MNKDINRIKVVLAEKKESTNCWQNNWVEYIFFEYESFLCKMLWLKKGCF